jgi:hypothetical protein
MSIVTEAFGGNGGTLFEIEAVKSLGVRSHARIDALLLNGSRRGGAGGTEREILEFHPDEYINYLAIKSGARVDRLEIGTNKGRGFNYGGNGGTAVALRNIRVLGLGGNSGSELDKLRVRYIPNYTESSLIEGNQVAIIDILAPGESIEQSVSREVSHLSAAKRILAYELTLGVGSQLGTESNPIGEFVAKLTASVGLKRTSTTEINEEIRIIEESSQKRTFSTPMGSVGLDMVLVDVYREAENGLVWLFPVSESQIVTVPLDSGLAASTGAYDLTRLVAVQLPSMANRLEDRYGYHYFRAMPTMQPGLVAVQLPSMVHRLEKYDLDKHVEPVAH